MNRDNKQLEEEAADWVATVFASVLIVALLLGSVWGHHVVSMGVMP